MGVKFNEAFDLVHSGEPPFLLSNCFLGARITLCPKCFHCNFHRPRPTRPYKWVTNHSWFPWEWGPVPYRGMIARGFLLAWCILSCSTPKLFFNLMFFILIR